MSKKSLDIKRFSTHQLIDYGRAKYFLEKAKWNYSDAVADLQKDSKKAEDLQKENDDKKQDLFNVDNYKIRRKTSAESEKFKLNHGESILVEEENGEVSILTEGVKSENKEQKELDLVSKDHINVGRAKFFLDKCNWRFQEARELAADSTYDKFLIYKNIHKYPNQYVDLVDGNITFRFIEASPPPQDNILTYFLRLRERFSLSNKQTKFVLSSVNGRYEIAEDLVLTYEAFENFGIYHKKSWKKLNTIMHYCEEHDRLQDIESKIVSTKPIDTEDVNKNNAEWQKKMSEVVKLYREKIQFNQRTLSPSLKNNNDDLIDHDEFDLLMFCRQQCKLLAPYQVDPNIVSKFQLEAIDKASAQEGEVIQLNEILIQRNKESKEALLFAFKVWTNTGNKSAKRILEKVKWNINDGLKLDWCIREYHNVNVRSTTSQFKKDLSHYFHNDKDFQEFLKTMCFLPCSVQESVAMKIAAGYFKERENYKDFLKELCGNMEYIDNTQYIKKKKAQKVAKEFYETDPDYTKFLNEMDKVSTYLSKDYVEFLEKKYFAHSKKDGEEFKNKVMEVQYAEKSAARDFVRTYFSYDKNYINFLKDMENHFKYISKEYLEVLGKMYFENDENYEIFLENLLDIPFIDKLAVKRFAKKHLCPDNALPSDISESDEKKEEETEKEKKKKEKKKKEKKEEEKEKEKKEKEKEKEKKEKEKKEKEKKEKEKKEKATANYNKFLENVFVIPFVKKDAVVDLTKKYYGSHENYAKFQKEMDDNPSYIHQKYFYFLGEEYFSKNEILKEFKKGFDSEKYVRKENITDLTKKHYGSHENYPKFKSEIMADYSFFYRKQYLEYLTETHFCRKEAIKYNPNEYKKNLTFLKNLFEVLYIEKKVAVHLVQKYCCPNKKYVEFQDKMVTENSRYLQKEKVESLVKDYFGEHKNYCSFQKRLFDVLFIGKEEAGKAAEEYYSSDVNFKKFIEAIEKDNCVPDDHIPREYIEFLLKKYFSDEKEYKKYVNEMPKDRYIKITAAKKLASTNKNYENFSEEIDGYSSYILRNYIEFLLKKYFSDEKNYQEFMLNLINVEYIKRDIVRQLELIYFKSHPNYKNYEEEKDFSSNYISKESLVALEKAFFRENKNYKKLQKKLFDVPLINKKRLIILSREYFCSDQRYKSFRDEIDVHSYYIDKQYLEDLGKKLLSKDFENIQKKWFEHQYIEKEIALAVAREYYLPTELFIFFERKLSSIPFVYMPKDDIERLGQEYFGQLKDYEKFHKKVLEVPYIRIDHVMNAAKEYFSNGREFPENYEIFKEELDDNPIFLRHQYLAALGKKYFSHYKNYQEYVNKLDDVPYVKNKTVRKVAEEFYPSHENYQNFLTELDIDQSTNVSSKYVVFLAEDNFGYDKKYMDFQKKFASDRYIKKETAQKFIEEQYSGDKYYEQKYKQFLKKINTNPHEYISKEYVWSLGEKHFKKEQNHMEFQKELINLPSNMIEEDADGVDDYFNYADDDEKTQKFINMEDKPLEYYINHMEKMINPSIYISKSYLEALVNRYFGKNKYCKYMDKSLDNLYIEEKTVKEVAEKYESNKNYLHLLKDMKDHSTNILKAYLLLLGYREIPKRLISGFVHILKDFKKNIDIQNFKEALQEIFPKDMKYMNFVQKINLIPSDLAEENRVKLTHTDNVQCLGIWTGLDYGKILQVYLQVCNNNFWDTLVLLIQKKKKNQLPSMNDYFLQLDEKFMRQKRLEFIISNISRQKGYFDEPVTLIDPKTDRDYHCKEGRLDIFPRPETEDEFGDKFDILTTNVTVYKDGILNDIHLSSYGNDSPLVEGILIGKRPFIIRDMGKEMNYYLVDRVDDYCPTDKFVFRN